MHAEISTERVQNMALIFSEHFWINILDGSSLIGLFAFFTLRNRLQLRDTEKK